LKRGHKQKHLLLGVLGLALLCGCASRPEGRFTVDALTIRGAQADHARNIESKIATQVNSHFLGIALSYEVYDAYVVKRDLQRIERYYRSKGYYNARVTAGRVIAVRPGEVRVEVQVNEGEPVKITQVQIKRISQPSEGADNAITAALQKIQVGEIFDEQEYAEARKHALQAMTDHGHAHAKIEGLFTNEDLAPVGGHAEMLQPVTDVGLMVQSTKKGEKDPKGVLVNLTKKVRTYGVRIDAVHHSAEVYLAFDPGPECTIDSVKIEGLGDLPENIIRRELNLKPGSPYSTKELESARNALLELGVFSSVEYRADLPTDHSTKIPVTFKLVPSPLHVVTLGGGISSDVIRTDTHFLAGYEHLNFLGGLRRLTMQAKPGTVLFPTNLQNLLPPTRLLPEIKSRAELRQPSFLESRLNGMVRSEFNVYPFLLPAQSAAEVPEVVVGYYEIQESAGLDRSFLNGILKLGTLYNLQLSFPFTYFGPTLGDGIKRVIISHVSLNAALDLRDNPIKPTRGAYFSNEFQIAGGALGGDASDLRIQPDARFYMPIAKRVTFAVRGSVGFLFPRSYASTLEQESPDPVLDPVGAANFGAQRNRDLQLLFFRAFFSGGPNSNRGYPVRGVGPRGVAPFHLGGNTTLSNCVGRIGQGGGVSGASSQLTKLPPIEPDLCAVPLGGLSMWEASMEVRVQLTKAFSTAIFLDGSDVTRKNSTLRFDYPHLSTGLGLRYDTLVGPVRLDVGYPIPGLQRLGQSDACDLDCISPSFLGLPIAVNIAVGEAF
jgi:outer membrane protein assembly factor BamA